MVDLKNILSYYWDLNASDKSLEKLPTHILLVASIQQMIEYLSYQKDYEGRMQVSTEEIILQLSSIISE